MRLETSMPKVPSGGNHEKLAKQQVSREFSRGKEHEKIGIEGVNIEWLTALTTDRVKKPVVQPKRRS